MVTWGFSFHWVASLAQAGTGCVLSQGAKAGASLFAGSTPLLTGSMLEAAPSAYLLSIFAWLLGELQLPVFASLEVLIRWNRINQMQNCIFPGLESRNQV